MSLASDSLPLDLIPKFTDAVTDVEGARRSDNVTVGGTLKKPVLNGDFTLDDAQFTLARDGRDVQQRERLRADDGRLRVRRLDCGDGRGGPCGSPARSGSATGASRRST